MIARKSVDNSLKWDYQVDKKCEIKNVEKKFKNIIIFRFSLDFQKWTTDFVVWGLVRFTLARRSALMILRTLPSILNSLQC